MTEIPTAEELEALFREGKMERIGDGSRRVCYAPSGGKLCVKSYRSEDELETMMMPDGSLVKHTLKPSVIREIRKARFDEKRNTSCQEYRYWKKLREKLPPEIFAVFPQTMECVLVPSRGWCVIEERVENYDGSNPKRFSEAYREADDDKKDKMLSALKSLVSDFVYYAVRFYDPQNLIVQNTADGGLHLRLVDFEPATRTLIPVDSLLPVLVRMKTKRRVSRWIREHLGLNGRLALPKKHRLSLKLRAKWDELIATEGAAMGLSDCSVFLENKLVNDILYYGDYKGDPCVVKCSSRAPESLQNEYEMLKRVYSIAPEVFPQPLAFGFSKDRRMAYVVMERLAGGVPSDPASDILRMAETLFATGIVHRDCSAANILCGADGHLKLIDFQFAVDRNDYKESVYMRNNALYLYAHFGNCESLGIGSWNDVLGFGFMECLRQFAPGDKTATRKLSRLAESMTFTAKPGCSVKILLRLYYLLVLLQSVFRCKPSLIWRKYKLAEMLKNDVGRVVSRRMP